MLLSIISRLHSAALRVLVLPQQVDNACLNMIGSRLPNLQVCLSHQPEFDPIKVLTLDCGLKSLQLAPLQGLGNLERFELKEAKNMPPDSMMIIRSFPKLRHLILHWGAPIRDDLMPHVAALTNLQALSLKGPLGRNAPTRSLPSPAPY